MKSDDIYPTHLIKSAAEQVRGSNIGESTWRKWLRLFSVSRYERTLTEEQSIYLLTYAYLRRHSPNKSLGVIDVKKHLIKMPYEPEKLKEQVEEGLFINVKGKDLPKLIRQYTGRPIHLRTLYRWANKHKLNFGAGKQLDRLEVLTWLRLAA